MIECKKTLTERGTVHYFTGQDSVISLCQESYDKIYSQEMAVCNLQRGGMLGMQFSGRVLEIRRARI